MRYKEKESSKPEVRYQSEINLLTIEKVGQEFKIKTNIILFFIQNGLERKLETAIKSKNHYKEQWIKALQEIAALKRREEANAKSLLKKQQIELDHLRMRYLAAEENNLIRTDEKQLETLRHDLNK
jgi:centrosomal protein CEP120